MNKENYAKVLAQIEAHPETWKQDSWHCGTQHCFAGHAQILSGRQPDDETVRRDARIFLDLSRVEADYFFSAYRTLEDFRAGYNRAGYDRAGYDRAGYDRDGYDRAGYNCAGYYLAGCDGYYLAGCDGYNRSGFARDGYNRAGYDSDGLDKHNKTKS